MGVNHTKPMKTVFLTQSKFAILPQGPDYLFEADAEFFENEAEAYDSAYDWSADLGGDVINLCKLNHKGSYDVIAQIYA